MDPPPQYKQLIWRKQKKRENREFTDGRLQLFLQSHTSANLVMYPKVENGVTENLLEPTSDYCDG